MATAQNIIAGGAYIKLSMDSSELKHGLEESKTRIQKFCDSVNEVTKQMSILAIAAYFPLKKIISAFSDYETMMRHVQGITGSTAIEMKRLSEYAKELGRTTSYTTAQVGSAMKELARLGYTTDEIQKSVRSVMNLAKATGTDLAQSAQLAGNMLRVFQRSVEDVSRIGDVIVKTVNSSAQSMDDYAEAASKAAPTFYIAGASIEDMSASIAILSNVGIRGALAGTALARAFRRVANPEVREMLHGYGVEVEDASGKLLSLRKITENVVKATRHLSDADRINMFEKVFEVRGATSAMAIGANIDKIDEMYDSLMKCDGVMQSTAEHMDSGIYGTLKRIESAWESTYIVLGEIINDGIRPIAETIVIVLKNVNKLFEAFGPVIKLVSQFSGFVVMSGASIAIITKIGQGFKLALSPLTALENAIFGVNKALEEQHKKTELQRIDDNVRAKEAIANEKRIQAELERSNALRAKSARETAERTLANANAKVSENNDKISRLTEERRKGKASLESQNAERRARIDALNAENSQITMSMPANVTAGRRGAENELESVNREIASIDNDILKAKKEQNDLASKIAYREKRITKRQVKDEADKKVEADLVREISEYDRQIFELDKKRKQNNDENRKYRRKIQKLQKEIDSVHGAQIAGNESSNIAQYENLIAANSEKNVDISSKKKEINNNRSRVANRLELYKNLTFRNKAERSQNTENDRLEINWIADESRKRFNEIDSMTEKRNSLLERQKQLEREIASSNEAEARYSEQRASAMAKIAENQKQIKMISNEIDSSKAQFDAQDASAASYIDNARNNGRILKEDAKNAQKAFNSALREEMRKSNSSKASENAYSKALEDVENAKSEKQAFEIPAEKQLDYLVLLQKEVDKKKEALDLARDNTDELETQLQNATEQRRVFESAADDFESISRQSNGSGDEFENEEIANNIEQAKQAVENASMEESIASEKVTVAHEAEAMASINLSKAEENLANAIKNATLEQKLQNAATVQAQAKIIAVTTATWAYTAAVNALKKALMFVVQHPITAAMMIIPVLTKLIDHFSKTNENSIESLRKMQEENDSLRRKEKSRMNSISDALSVLSAYQRAGELNDSQMNRSREIISMLASEYGILGISVEETTGKINGAINALEKFEKLKREREKQMKRDEYSENLQQVMNLGYILSMQSAKGSVKYLGQQNRILSALGILNNGTIDYSSMKNPEEFGRRIDMAILQAEKDGADKHWIDLLNHMKSINANNKKLLSEFDMSELDEKLQDIAIEEEAIDKLLESIDKLNETAKKAYSYMNSDFENKFEGINNAEREFIRQYDALRSELVEKIGSLPNDSENRSVLSAELEKLDGHFNEAMLGFNEQRADAWNNEFLSSILKSRNYNAGLSYFGRNMKEEQFRIMDKFYSGNLDGMDEVLVREAKMRESYEKILEARNSFINDSTKSAVGGFNAEMLSRSIFGQNLESKIADATVRTADMAERISGFVRQILLESKTPAWD